MTASDLVELAGREAIAPCPFCGGEAEIINVDDGENAGGSCVSCTRCLASSNLEFGRKENFVSNWNRRVALRESFGAWTDIPTAKRFGRTLTSDAVEHLKAGTLLRFYSPDPWFEPGEHMPSCGEIVVFTGKVNNDYPRIGPHLEVSTIDGDVYPGGGWVYRLFQFVGEAASALRERIPLPGVEGREEGSSRELHQGSVVDAGSSATRERLIKHIRAALVEADFISTMGFEDRIKARTKLAEAVVTEIFGDGAERAHEGKLRDEPSILPLSSSRGEAEQK